MASLMVSFAASGSFGGSARDWPPPTTGEQARRASKQARINNRRVGGEITSMRYCPPRETMQSSTCRIATVCGAVNCTPGQEQLPRAPFPYGLAGLAFDIHSLGLEPKHEAGRYWDLFPPCCREG